MQKYLFKAKIRTLVFAAVILIVLTLIGNIFLTLNEPVLEEQINIFPEYNISFGSATYLFPNTVAVKSILIDKKSAASGFSTVELSELKIRLSLVQLIMRGQWAIPSVTLYSSAASYYSLSEFLEDNSKQLLEIIRNSSGNNIRVRIRETLLDFDRSLKPDYVATELMLALQGDSVTGTGMFRIDQYEPFQKEAEIRRSSKGWPLWYHINATLKPDGFTIDRLIFSSGNFYSNLSGSLRGGILKINGFAFMDTTKQNPDEMKGSVSRYFKNFPTDSSLSHIDMHILDIDGQVALTYPSIAVDHFDCTFNNVPVTLKGRLSLMDPPRLDADLSLREAPSPANPLSFIKTANMKFNSVVDDDTLKTNGLLNVQLNNVSGSRLFPEKGEFGIHDLTLRIDEQLQTQIFLSKGTLAYWTHDNEHRLTVENFKAVSKTEMEGYKVVEISSPFYQGTMEGRIWIDSTRLKPRVKSYIILTDVETDALEELLVHFGKFNGRMTSKMNFVNDPRLELNGEVVIYDGELTDFGFFNWVGDSFSLPRMKAIGFSRGSAEFSINDEQVRLDDIRLMTGDVHIGGYYHVDNKNLVTSELTLGLSKEFLSESPKFRPILKTIGDKTPYLDFDFRLSGNADAINFQWLSSPVKREIQSRIPDFIERKIEQDVDTMIEENPK